MLIYISHFGNYYIVLRVVTKILLRRRRRFVLATRQNAYLASERRDKYENIDYGPWTISCLTERIYYLHIFENHIVLVWESRAGTIEKLCNSKKFVLDERIDLKYLSADQEFSCKMKKIKYFRDGTD